MDRISGSDYVPTNKDILHARKATKGSVEYHVEVNNVPFTFIDVGGQRSQRQKWFQCFDTVTSILFLVGTSEYDQTLLEDRKTNRLLESKQIFENIVNHRAFAEVSMILFLNKTDLLAEKLRRLSVAQKSQAKHEAMADSKLSMSTIREPFPEFRGDALALNDVQQFILNMFDESRRDRRKVMYHHFTTAVDTENIKYVFNAVRSTILRKNISELMLQ